MQQLEFDIHGSDLQMLEVHLRPNQSVQAEAGCMVFMERAIKMSTSASGGVFSGLKRMVTGASFFMTQFSNIDPGKNATVAFAASYPGKLLAIDLSEHGGEIIAQRDSFLCAASEVGVDLAFTKRFSTGMFGGDGFILQKISGAGHAFIHAGGMLLQKELAAGQELRVDAGCLAAFEGSVEYSIEMVRGVRNMFFGGEGLFFAKLIGPGKVYIQSMPFAKFALQLARALPRQNNS